MTFKCQCCGHDCASACAKRVPGLVPMGRVLMDAFVCDGCQDECCEGLNREIWKGNPALHDTRCNMCDCGFGSEGPYLAHRRPLPSGEWEMAPVCCGCFTKYKECCAKLMKA